MCWRWLIRCCCLSICSAEMQAANAGFHHSLWASIRVLPCSAHAMAGPVGPLLCQL